MRFSFSFISDLLFTAFISFCLSFIFLYYFLPHRFAFLYALLFAVLVSAIFFKFRKTRSDKLNLSKKKNKEIDEVVTTLQFMPNAELKKLFEKGLKNQKLTPVYKRNGFFVPELNLFILLKFGYENTEKADIMRTFNNLNKGETAQIFSESFSDEIINFASRFDNKILLLDKVKTYEFLSGANALPKITKTPIKGNTVKTIVTGFFKKKKATKYLLFGITFLGFSFLTTFKIYYITFGCCLLIFSLLCRLIGTENNA